MPRPSATSLAGLAVGMAAGMAAGLLLAPVRGSELRSTIAGQTATQVDRLRSLANSGRTWVEERMPRNGDTSDRRRDFARNRAVAANTPLTATLQDIASTHIPSSSEVS
jgi:gas vesicle protein